MTTLLPSEHLKTQDAARFTPEQRVIIITMYHTLQSNVSRLEQEHEDALKALAVCPFNVLNVHVCSREKLIEWPL